MKGVPMDEQEKQYMLIEPNIDDPLLWVKGVLRMLWLEGKLTADEHYNLRRSLISLREAGTCSWCGSGLTWQGYCPWCDDE